MKMRLSTLLADAMESFPANDLDILVRRRAETAVETMGNQANSSGICRVETSIAMRIQAETVTSTVEVLSEGRMNRCLYLLASCSVDEPYS